VVKKPFRVYMRLHYSVKIGDWKKVLSVWNY